MKLLRFLLIASLVMVAYAIGAAVYLYPRWEWAIALLVLLRYVRPALRLFACGTAMWATHAQIPHLIGGKGLSVGIMEGKPTRLEGLRAIFNRRLSARHAVWMFLSSVRKRPPKPLVRLNTAVHSLVVAPTGVGKSSAVAIPFLLHNTDSAVVVDFKAEIAAKTIEARRKMGHRIVIFDPFHAFTKTPDRLNPLPFVKKENAVADARVIAESLIRPKSTAYGRATRRASSDPACIWPIVE
jgi:type IV secretion system protein VirD4